MLARVAMSRAASALVPRAGGTDGVRLVTRAGAAAGRPRPPLHPSSPPPRGLTAARGSSSSSSSSGATTNTLHGGQIKVAHILMPPESESELDELRERIDADVATLADLARAHSTCPSASAGGVIGWIDRGQTVPAFEEVAFSTPIGGPVGKATTQFGVHLIEVLETRASAPTIVDVTVDDLAEVLEGDLDEVQLIDVREQDEWDQMRLPQFTLKPLSAAQVWAPRAAEDFDPNKPTYVLCAAGVRSMHAGRALIDQGFTDVRNVAGGINAAARAGMVR